MRIFKIILGLIILQSLAHEYISFCKQTGELFDLGIAVLCLLMLILCAWLIGSGIANKNLSIKSGKFWMYYGICLPVVFVLLIVNAVTYRFPTEIVSVNGVDVNIAEMMQGNRRTIPDEAERRAFCLCMVGKLTQDKELVERYAEEFQSGELSGLLVALQNHSDKATKYNFEECRSAVKHIEWSPELEASARKNMAIYIRNIEAYKTNDTAAYCDCMIEALKKIPFKEWSSPDFLSSEAYRRMDSICDATSLREGK